MDKSILAMAQRVLLEQQNKKKYDSIGIASETGFQNVSIRDMVSEIGKTAKEVERLQVELEAAKRDLVKTACCSTCKSWHKNGGHCAPIKPKGMLDCTVNEDNQYEWEWRGPQEGANQ